jgi:hypothetical protein
MLWLRVYGGLGVLTTVFTWSITHSLSGMRVNSEEDVFRSPWSDQTVQPLNCSPFLPWAMLVLVLGTTLKGVLAMCA